LIRAVADGVDDHVQSFRIGACNPLVELFLAVEQQTAVARLVVEGFVKRRRVGAERAVDEALQRAEGKPGIAPAMFLDVVAKSLPARKRDRRVDASLESLSLAGAAEDFESFPASHVVNRRHALGGDVTHRGFESAIVRCVTGGWEHVVDGVHRVVFQDTGRLVRGVADDGATGDVLGVYGDAGGFERQSVRESHVAVEAVDPHRVARCELVDHASVGKLATPELVVPITAGDPCSLGHGLGEGADAPRELLWSRGVSQLHGGELEPSVEKMNVGVDEARGHESARSVDDFGITELRSDFFAGADRENTTFAHEHGFGDGVIRISGPDVSIEDGEARDRGGAGIFCGSARTQSCEQDEGLKAHRELTASTLPRVDGENLDFVDAPQTGDGQHVTSSTSSSSSEISRMTVRKWWTSRVNVTASFSPAPASVAASNTIEIVIAFMHEPPRRAPIVVRTPAGFNTTGK